MKFGELFSVDLETRKLAVGYALRGRKVMIAYKMKSLPHLLSLLRVQMLLCTIIGIAVPAFLYSITEETVRLSSMATKNTLSASVLATAVSLISIRKFGEFPGSIGASYILPAFAASYSVAVSIIFFARVPYSGKLLTLTFACSLILRFAISALESRREGGHFYIVPGGEVDRIRRDLQVPSFLLEGPALPTDPGAVIVADLHHSHSSEWERAFAAAALRGIAVYHYKQVWEAQTGKVRIEHLSENSLGSLIPSSGYAKAKRFIDICLIVLATPVILPLFILTAVFIIIDSGAPVFFRQERIGYRGRSFRVLKFRTMKTPGPTDGEKDRVHDAITKDDDDRITRIGHFLRKTRIDELPQIFNILRGEMSWIGPRPEAQPLSEWYEKEIPFYSYRHIVRPGITGWAQVNQGHVATVKEVHDKLRFDFYYIKNFSMWLDLVILFKTVLVVLRGSGAK